MPKGKYKRELKKNGAQYLKYKSMALDFIKAGYVNIRGIYKKYHPNAKMESIDCEAYRLLDNDRFKMALEEVWDEIKVEDLDIARDVIRVLHNIALKGKKDSDRINAASWLGKSKGLFIDKQEVTEVNKDDNQFSLERLSRIKQNEN